MSAADPFLRVGSMIWSATNHLARNAARRGWIPSTRLEAGRTISVGNLQAGGAGKTPIVALIANQAHQRGLSVCILCRGYRSRWEAKGGLLAPAKAQAAPGIDPAVCGDEPALLHELAPHAWIGVGSDRIAGYRRAVEEHVKAFDLVLLDDGLQHFRIERDLDVVALSSAQGRPLFREFESALEPSMLAVWTKGEREPEVFRKHPVDRRVRMEFELNPPEAAGPFWLVSGVGSPAQVRDSAERAGFAVKRHLCFPDHARYSERMVGNLLTQAQDAGARIALTGKDWVKWRALGIDRAQVLVLEPKLKIHSGEQVWNRCLWGEGL